VPPDADRQSRGDPYSSIVGKFDLIIYVANLTTKSNQTAVRIEWAQPMGANVPIT
jgi:beta-N-acetylhexosaminidase